MGTPAWRGYVRPIGSPRVRARYLKRPEKTQDSRAFPDPSRIADQFFAATLRCQRTIASGDIHIAAAEPGWNRSDRPGPASDHQLAKRRHRMHAHNTGDGRYPSSRSQLLNQVKREIRAQHGDVDAGDLDAALNELSDAELSRLAAQTFAAADQTIGSSTIDTSGREPEQPETVAAALHDRVVACFRAGKGLPLPLFREADLPLSLLIGPFLQARGMTSGTAASYRTAFERLIEVVGDRAPSALTPEDLEAYADALRAKRSNKCARGTLSAATLAKDIGHIREFFAAVAGSQPGRSNPAAMLEVPKRSKTPAGASRITPLTEDQLRRLGRAPIFRGCEDSRHITRPGDYLCRDGRFWFGVLKPFAGVGSGEAMALLTTDVRRHHGIWHIDLHNDSRTGAGNRMVPVHPALIEMGFLEWVRERQAAIGGGRLFEPRKYARVWNDGILSAAGLKNEGVTVEGLRMNFMEAVLSGANERIAMRLTGQALGPAHERVLDHTDTMIAHGIVSEVGLPSLR